MGAPVPSRRALFWLQAQLRTGPSSPAPRSSAAALCTRCGHKTFGRRSTCLRGPAFIAAPASISPLLLLRLPPWACQSLGPICVHMARRWAPIACKWPVAGPLLRGHGLSLGPFCVHMARRWAPFACTWPVAGPLLRAHGPSLGLMRAHGQSPGPRRWPCVRLLARAPLSVHFPCRAPLSSLSQALKPSPSVSSAMPLKLADSKHSRTHARVHTQLLRTHLIPAHATAYACSARKAGC